MDALSQFAQSLFGSALSMSGIEAAKMLVMWAIGGALIYLAIKKDMEPTLLLPMGFGAILVNLPLSGVIDQGIDPVTGIAAEPGALSELFRAGIDNELFPLLLFIGIGAMIDFGPLLQNPKLLLFGAAAPVSYTHLDVYKRQEAGMAAKYASLFYLGITLGRFFCGFVSDRWGDHNMVRLGQGIAGLGGLLLLLPLGGAAPLCALVALGLGCAPIYPSLLHATPANFGAENSQSIMGMQMACAYVGSTFMPPVFGWLAGWAGLRLYPVYLLFFVLLMALMTERAGKSSAAKDARA